MIQKTLRLLIGSALLAVAGPPALAASLTAAVDGVLGPPVLALHADFGGAPFSGQISFDLASRQIESGNSNPYYQLTSWSILVSGDNGSSLLLESSGETYDAGLLTLSRASDIVVLLIDEDIDNPASGAIEDTTLRLYFDPQMDITVDTTFEDLGPLVFLPPSSLLQFSTSQAPMTVVSASLVPVPVPAAAWLFGSALGLFGVIRRRKPAPG